MRNFELAGRSPVYAANGMAATSHPLATMTAINILQSGGNAMDAAVAACAVQCVVEPQSTGIGGDCFMLYAPKGGADIVAYNGSGQAPAAATLDWFQRNSIDSIERTSPHAVTVPGAVNAWATLIEDHGSMSLGELLQPAIRFAQEGYPVYPKVAFDWNNEREVLAQDVTAARLFMPDGKLPAVGELHRQKELAATLEIIAKQGKAGFYSGPVAEDMVNLLQSKGGLHTLDDFAAVTGEYVNPIKTDYRGYQVYECPPNGQGIAALMLLNLLSGFDLSELSPLSAQRLLLLCEASRLAYQDRDNYVGDPAKADVPIGQLLSMDYANQRRQSIKHDRVMSALPESDFPPHSDTVCLSVVDRDRNAVSFINSLFNSFGCGLISPKTGVCLHSRGQGFNLKPGHASCIAPGKRPLHTIIPGMLVKDNHAVMPFGVMGGHYQSMGHAYFLSNMIDHGLDIQEAIDLPRLFPEQDGVLAMESGFSQEIKQQMGDYGYQVQATDRPTGGAQAIWIDQQQGTLIGGSDPRKDGCAIGY